MKMSSELIVGNIWLFLLKDEERTEFAQKDFVDYAQKIDEKIKQDSRIKGYVDVSLSDILDTASCVSCCVNFDRLPGDEFPSRLTLKEGGREMLKRKLEVYFKSITPQELRAVMDDVFTI